MIIAKIEWLSDWHKKEWKVFRTLEDMFIQLKEIYNYWVMEYFYGRELDEEWKNEIYNDLKSSNLIISPIKDNDIVFYFTVFDDYF